VQGTDQLPVGSTESVLVSAMHARFALGSTGQCRARGGNPFMVTTNQNRTKPRYFTKITTVACHNRRITAAIVWFAVWPVAVTAVWKRSHSSSRTSCHMLVKRSQGLSWVSRCSA